MDIAPTNASEGDRLRPDGPGPERGTIPPLRTARLRLRPLGEADRALFCRLYTDPELMRHIGPPLSEADAARRFRAACRRNRDPALRQWIWVLAEAHAQSDIGLLGLTRQGDAAEIGALLPLPWQGQGYAAEAIAALVEHAFTLPGLARLFTRHRGDHAAAAGLMRKLGFERRPTEDGGPLDCLWIRSRPAAAAE